MNLMLNVFETFANNFVRRMQMPEIIVALVCAIIGVSLTFLARRIARVVHKTNDVQDDDSVLISVKAVALVFLFISLLIIIFRGI